MVITVGPQSSGFIFSSSSSVAGVSSDQASVSLATTLNHRNIIKALPTASRENPVDAYLLYHPNTPRRRNSVEGGKPIAQSGLAS